MPVSVAIVGAGPAGFYAAEALLARDDRVEVDIIERLASPFGLVRAGVAPDHQSTKRVARRFSETAVHEVVHFYGNVEVGRDVTLDELAELYDAVILAVGAPTDRPLDIPGARLAGVYGASAFVGWYNGHPDFRDLAPRLDTERAVVIGNGNVALDVARVLVRSAEELASSDIAAYAAAAVTASPLHTVDIVGRRGPADARFSPAELREMGELAACVPEVDASVEEASAAAADARERRAIEKNLAILRGFRAAGRTAGASKRVRFRFYRRPVAVLGRDRVESIRLERTGVKDGRLSGTGLQEEVACGLVVSAIGYRGTPIPSAPYDHERGLIANVDGRVGPRLYVVGWAQRGPTGVIGTNRPDGIRCAEQVLADVAAPDADAGVVRPGRSLLEPLLARRGARVVTFDDWLRIDAAEVAAAVKPAPRRKFTALAEMLAVLERRGQSRSRT
jgi:ferredoxin--NADP+ reductase